MHDPLGGIPTYSQQEPPSGRPVGAASGGGDSFRHADIHRAIAVRNHRPMASTKSEPSVVPLLRLPRRRRLSLVLSTG